MARPLRPLRQLSPGLLLVLLPAALVSAAPVPVSPVGGWRDTPVMAAPRATPSAARLPDGRLLVVGFESGPGCHTSAEIYDPATGGWTGAGTLRCREALAATALLDGRVLIVGGDRQPVTSQLFDPASGWGDPVPLGIDLGAPTVTLLLDGRVLAVGWEGVTIYDPRSGAWTPNTGPNGTLRIPRVDYTATRLADGRVLIAGGALLQGSRSPVLAAELYDPTSNSFSLTGSLLSAHYLGAAVEVAPGRVLLAGNLGAGGDLAELYDAGSGTWLPAGRMQTPRGEFRLAPTRCGVLAASGRLPDLTTTPLADLYLPAAGAWLPAAPLGHDRMEYAAAALPGGQVLVAGGESFKNTVAFGYQATPLTTAEIFDPGTTPCPSGIPGLPLPGASSVSAQPPQVPADGATASTLTVSLRDVVGQPLPGRSVGISLASGPGSPTISPPRARTGGDGRARFAVTSLTPGSDSFQATDTDDRLVLPQQAAVTFTPVLGAGGPRVGSVRPSTGPTAGGTRVSIGGGGLTAVDTVHFGPGGASAVLAPCGRASPGVPCFSVLSDSAITAVSPPHPAAVVDITVEAGGVASPLGPNDRFAYADPQAAGSVTAGLRATGSEGAAGSVNLADRAAGAGFSGTGGGNPPPTATAGGSGHALASLALPVPLPGGVSAPVGGPGMVRDEEVESAPETVHQMIGRRWSYDSVGVLAGAGMAGCVSGAMVSSRRRSRAACQRLLRLAGSTACILSK